MAKAAVVHSEDAVTIVFHGDIRRPEPSTAIVKFPGGHVEVARCTDGSYWAHLQVVGARNILDSRIEYEYGATSAVTDLPEAEKVTKLALRVGNEIAHPGEERETPRAELSAKALPQMEQESLL